MVAVVALAVGITTLPRSGPFCRSACVTYPYTNAAAFVPRDYLWMYPGLLLALPFVVLAACIHHHASPDRKVFSRTAGSLAVIAAAAIVVEYGIQLTGLQPSLLKGETAGLSLFSQYNPHGIFIALENVGYLVMGLAFLLFAGVAVTGRSGLQRAIR